MSFSPSLPYYVSSLSMNGLNYLGRTFDVHWTSKEVTVTLTSSSSSDPLSLTISGGSAQPLTSSPISFPMSSALHNYAGVAVPCVILSPSSLGGCMASIMLLAS